ncbi:MAG: folylpolyglutamate synthase/dihydrofolate synthase family protein [Bacteroidota bacterium]
MQDNSLTYEQSLDFLYTQLPMFQRVGQAAFKKDLTNIKRLCAALGHPEKAFKSIHLAGTNGKGSVAHMLSACLQASGYKTGLYTSPHYIDFRERIKMDGKFVSKEFVRNFVSRHSSLFEQIRPSFFEITVAMAFCYFADQQVDVAVIETGLGGRLDSTNVILPELCVITNISFDHQQFLGNTLDAIAGEKAGIIKENVPVVVGEEQAESKDVFVQTAAERRAPIVFASQQFELRNLASSWTGLHADVWKNGKLYLKDLHLDVGGAYQQFNVRTALQALECLRQQTFFGRLSESSIRKGLANVKSLAAFMGRWQVIGQQPLILCDSAHNEAGIRMAMTDLGKSSFPHWHIVFGMVNDKEVDKVLSLFPAQASYYFAKANIPRGKDGEELRAQAQALGRQGKAYPSVADALAAARSAAKEDDLIYVGGSIFVVAEVLPSLQGQHDAD